MHRGCPITSATPQWSFAHTRLSASWDLQTSSFTSPGFRTSWAGPHSVVAAAAPPSCLRHGPALQQWVLDCACLRGRGKTMFCCPVSFQRLRMGRGVLNSDSCWPLGIVNARSWPCSPCVAGPVACWLRLVFSRSWPLRGRSLSGAPVAWVCLALHCCCPRRFSLPVSYVGVTLPLPLPFFGATHLPERGLDGPATSDNDNDHSSRMHGPWPFLCSEGHLLASTKC